MEEIEELRAKVIASMPSSGNPNPNPKPRSPASKEEGELSAAEDEELPTCYTSLPDTTTRDEPFLTDLRSNLAQNMKPVNTLPASSSSMSNMQHQRSVTQSHSKHLKTRHSQMPFKSSNSRALSWHGKGSDDNLVISFSDDDSRSDSEEFRPAKITISKKDSAVRANRSKMPMTSVQIQSEGLQRATNRTKPMPKKGFVNRASISSIPKVSGANIRCPVFSVEKDSLIPMHNSAIKSSASQERGHVRDLTDHRLESLRHEIALRENELQNKSMPQSKEKNAYSYHCGPNAMKLETKAAGISRSASVSSIGLAPNERAMKRPKLDGSSNSKLSSDGQLQLLTPSTKPTELGGQAMESSNCVMENSKCPHDRNSVRNLEVSSRHENHSTYVSDVSCSGHQSEKNVPVDSSTILDQSPCMAQTAPSIEDGALRESDMPILRNPSTKSVRNSNLARGTDASNVFAKKAACEYNVAPGKQIVVTTGARIPLEASNHIFEKHSIHVPESTLGNGEINISGDTSMNLQSLVELEELQDKELEAAQELRRRCELEERCALKAYRKAQRALVDANERCSLLYRKRELFSSQLRALIMEASSSMWPSGWQRHKGTLLDSVKSIPKACFDLSSSFGHQMPGEGQILDQLGYESNSQCPVGAPLDPSFQQTNEDDFVSDHCWTHDASTSDHRDNSAVDGGSPAHHANMHTDYDENFSFDNRLVESMLPCDISEGNLRHRTADVNDEIERLSSIENAQDYELLEASLRSKLVAQLGMRTSSKSCGISHTVCSDRRGADSIGDNKKSSALPHQQMQEGEKTQTSDFAGVERPERSTTQLTAQRHSQSNGNNIFITDEADRNRYPEDNSSVPRESCWPTHTDVFSLPSSALRVVSGHAKFILPGCYSGLFTTKEKDFMLRTSSKEVTMYVPDVRESTTWYSMRSARTGETDLHNCDLAIDPFWPLCMFELRGKCNNEECRWQHLKNCTWRNLKHKEHLATSSSDDQVGHSLTVGKSKDGFGPTHGLLYDISVPTYHIGSNLIKVDSHLCQSVLAGSIWQYWQRGFCASFSLPFSVQRILPSDAPFLQTGDGPIADDYSWNRLSLYHQRQDGTVKQFMEGLHDSEQSLEMALDLFDGKVYKPHRKALSLLSRAIEADPSSVVLWVVYLHIYYRKEKGIGKDDMFFHAVQHNEGSYELWLMYINSRMHLGDRLNAYDNALTILCHRADTFDKERKYISACILDIFLQMIDFLCMSGNVDKAIWRIYGLLPATGLEISGDALISDIHSCLIVSDKCIFWFCCIYLAIYRKLPQVIVQHYEFEKDLPFGTEWPSAQLTTDRKDRALELLEFAVDQMALDTDNNPYKGDPAVLRALHFLAVSHVECVGALEGLHCSADLLSRYLKLYPTSIELALLFVRLQGNCSGDVVFRWFEESLCNWPKEIPGVQCLWNQYAEYALAGKRFDFAEKLMTHWFQDFMKVKYPHNRDLEGGENESCGSFDLPSHVNSDGGINFVMKDDIFRLLNLSLYRLLQKKSAEAHHAIDKALKLAAAEDFKHCVREHAAFIFSTGSDSLKDIPVGVVLDLLNSYLGDSRSTPTLEPLSRRYYRNIKKLRTRQLINNILGPVPRDCTLMNSVLEVCYGPSLLPEEFVEPKDLVDLVESLMEITPANYQLALSVYKFISTNFSHGSVASNAIKFWASSILVNSIFQALPVAPEHVWLEAANVMSYSENLDISLRFHKQAVSVYPFSINLWKSYSNLSRNTGDVDTIIESARERGVELMQVEG